MPETKPRVGFIGIGAMGIRMSQHILEAGFPLTVYDRQAGKNRAAGSTGIPVASSCAEVASKSDVVITMIGQVADELEVVLGADGVLEGAHPGLTLIESSTVGIAALEKTSRQP